MSLKVYSDFKVSPFHHRMIQRHLEESCRHINDVFVTAYQNDQNIFEFSMKQAALIRKHFRLTRLEILLATEGQIESIKERIKRKVEQKGNIQKLEKKLGREAVFNLLYMMECDSTSYNLFDTLGLTESQRKKFFDELKEINILDNIDVRRIVENHFKQEEFTKPDDKLDEY